MLVDFEIRQQIESGNLVIDPYDPQLVGPNSLDVRLARQVTRYQKTDVLIDSRNKESVEYGVVKEETDSFILLPGGFALASTIEKIRQPKNIVSLLHGRSSYARTGIQIHSAGFIDAGFSDPPASITLELVNLGPRAVRLYAGDRIGQLSFFLTAECEISYSERKHSKYNGQEFAQISKCFMDQTSS